MCVHTHLCTHTCASVLTAAAVRAAHDSGALLGLRALGWGPGVLLACNSLGLKKGQGPPGEQMPVRGSWQPWWCRESILSASSLYLPEPGQNTELSYTRLAYTNHMTPIHTQAHKKLRRHSLNAKCEGPTGNQPHSVPLMDLARARSVIHTTVTHNPLSVTVLRGPTKLHPSQPVNTARTWQWGGRGQNPPATSNGNPEPTQHARLKSVHGKAALPLVLGRPPLPNGLLILPAVQV